MGIDDRAPDALLSRRTLLAGGTCVPLTGLLAAPAAAERALDVRILQTASSIEVLTVAAYTTFLGTEAVRGGNPVLKRVVQTTLLHHEEHRKAFQSQTLALGGTKQEAAHPALLSIVEQSTSGLLSPLDVVALAEALETTAAQTYLKNTVDLEDTAAKRVMASVMGVESQHAAVLRAMKALLEGATPDLIAIPLDTGVATLPPAFGSVAFPDAFEPTAGAAAPDSGAVA